MSGEAIDLMDEEDEIEFEIDVVEDEDVADDEAEEGKVVKKVQAEASHEDELDQVSDTVKRRIAAMREQAQRERLASDALARDAEKVSQTAQRLRKENETLKSIFAQGEKAFVEQSRTGLEAEITNAKRAYKEAFENGDADKVAEAQVVIADLAARKRELEAYRPAEFDAPPEIPRITRQPAPQAPPVDQKAQEWLKKNDWFARDEEMSAVALATHRRLVKEGVHPVEQSDAYYKEVDAVMRRRFPEKFEKKTTARPSVVAGVTQSVTGGKTTTRVKLTESQVRLAKNLGLTPQQYASQVIKEMRGDE